jgi:hypothetical protein
MPKILFLNFDGGTLHSGSCNNSANNCSWLISGSLGTVQFPAFSGSETAKQAILLQVRRYYAPFNIAVVSARPGSGVYSMTMVGGHASDIGMAEPTGSYIGGVAPLDCGNQEDDDISFAFSASLLNGVHDVAVTAAQESSHGFGLGHTDDQTDIMYPLLSGRETAFLDKEMHIYDAGAASSSCDGTGMQNSYQALLATLGANTGPDTLPPEISLTSPHNGDTVASRFMVTFDASDNVAVASVELFVNGTSLGNSVAAPFTFTVPENTVPAGSAVLKGVATDLAGNTMASDPITVTVRALGQSPGDLGAPCGGAVTCAGGQECATDPSAGDHFCTHRCNGPSDCPHGFECTDAGGFGICVSEARLDNGCGIARRGLAPPVTGFSALLLLGLGAALLRRRRRGRR